MKHDESFSVLETEGVDAADIDDVKSRYIVAEQLNAAMSCECLCCRALLQGRGKG